MAIKGKREYKVYLDEEITEYVKSFLDSTRFQGGFSRLVDEYIKTMGLTLKASNYKPGEKIGAAKLTRVFLNGLRQDVV